MKRAGMPKNGSIPALFEMYNTVFMRKMTER